MLAPLQCPVDDGDCVHRPRVDGTAPAYLDTSPPPLADWPGVLGEDRMICEAVQRNLASGPVDPGALPRSGTGLLSPPR